MKFGIFVKPHVLFGFRTIAPVENYRSTLKLTLTLNQTLTPTGGQFSSGGIVLRIPFCLLKIINLLIITKNAEKFKTSFISEAATGCVL